MSVFIPLQNASSEAEKYVALSKENETILQYQVICCLNFIFYFIYVHLEACTKQCHDKVTQRQCD